MQNILRKYKVLPLFILLSFLLDAARPISFLFKSGTFTSNDQNKIPSIDVSTTTFLTTLNEFSEEGQYLYDGEEDSEEVAEDGDDLKFDINKSLAYNQGNFFQSIIATSKFVSYFKQFLSKVSSPKLYLFYSKLKIFSIL